jgi:hypothetical protein
MSATTTNTKSLPQLARVDVLDELFEKEADRWRIFGLGPLDVLPGCVREVTECGQMTGSGHECWGWDNATASRKISSGVAMRKDYSLMAVYDKRNKLVIHSTLRRVRPRNAQFVQTVVESGAVEAQACGGSLGSTNHPTRLMQDLDDVLAFDCFEPY